MIAYSKMGRQRLSLEVATEALSIIAQESSPPPPLTPVSIMTAVSDHFNVSLEHMRSKKRDAHLALARQMAIYLVREKTSYPLHSIGQLLGGRDHSTILRSYHKMSQEVTADAAAQRSIKQILHGLGQ